MQTFLPHSDFKMSARCLDYRRLGKQRVEVLQLLQGSFPHHPASKMWLGYEGALALYGLTICAEWIERGFRDSCLLKIAAYVQQNALMPFWFGGEIHATHRSNLLRKDPDFYGVYGWLEPHNLEYLWPV